MCGGSSTSRLVRKSETQRDRHVDEEDPAPVVVIGDPASQRRPDRGREHHGQPIERERLPALLRRKRVSQNRLLRRRQPPAARALQQPEEDQQRQRGRQSAQRRRDAEQHHADHVKLLAPNESSQVSRDRKNDRVRHQVAGQHPRRLILARAQRSRNVRQRHVRDGGVEALHERRHRHRQRDRPGIRSRLPRGIAAILRRLCGRESGLVLYRRGRSSHW